MAALTDDLETTGSAEAVSHYEAALEHLLYFRPEVGHETKVALELEPSLPMAQVLSAYLGLLGTEPSDASAARDRFAAFVAGSPAMNERERQHAAAAAAWLGGDMLGAGRILADLSLASPRDLLALAVGHQIDFFSGNATSLRDRVAGTLAAWSPHERAYGLVLGMLAFGLEESGLYERSGEVGLEAVERDGRDVWAIHAVVHTYEMRGRFADGLAFMDSRVADWGTGNFFNVHNWWHYCIYALEAGRPDVALRIYDAVLNGDATSGLVMEMLDATSLLWRMYLNGEDQSERFRALVQPWTEKMATPYYAFNDMHAAMAYVGSGDLASARALVAARENYIGEAPATDSNKIFTGEVGLPVIRAVLAFGEGRYDDAVEALWTIRHRVNLFGGSHAQRDAVQRTLVEAALRAGATDKARQLTSERLSVNPLSPYNWRQEARLLTEIGSRAEAASRRAEAMQVTATRFEAVGSLS